MSALVALLKLAVLALFTILAVAALVLFGGLLVREWRTERKVKARPITLELPPMLRELCPGCKAEVDNDWCWCGDLVEVHNPYNFGHSPVAMGCVCHQGVNSHDHS